MRAGSRQQLLEGFAASPCRGKGSTLLRILRSQEGSRSGHCRPGARKCPHARQCHSSAPRCSGQRLPASCLRPARAHTAPGPSWSQRPPRQCPAPAVPCWKTATETGERPEESEPGRGFPHHLTLNESHLVPCVRCHCSEVPSVPISGSASWAPAADAPAGSKEGPSPDLLPGEELTELRYKLGLWNQTEGRAVGLRQVTSPL